ncbi:MAG: carboxypeptidase-like regulatory domain-containing protein [Flavobacteriales bacterium]
MFGSVLLLGHLGVAQDTLRVQIHGTVLDSISLAPLAEVMVEWFDENGRQQAVSISNTDGRYAMFVRTTGSLDLRVEENGYRPFRTTVKDLRRGESARELDLRLRPLD